ncbi:hypothetical protein DPMN_043315 [Dreissena polymorpha]|uniref:Secreted protein n=1 Tax=Dreissena polymorpha TaxID=45954 RepID=A0A9D4D0R6_DREPO|nr:hypothetical protein DPMN_043315 [Dreissena polymorpha]
MDLRPFNMSWSVSCAACVVAVKAHSGLAVSAATYAYKGRVGCRPQLSDLSLCAPVLSCPIRMHMAQPFETTGKSGHAMNGCPLQHICYLSRGRSMRFQVRIGGSAYGRRLVFSPWTRARPWIRFRIEECLARRPYTQLPCACSQHAVVPHSFR